MTDDARATPHPPSRGRFALAIAAIDSANADDPNRIEVEGVEGPKELTHARMVDAWVRRLDPDASEALLLAARAHHVRRWTVPRDSFPAGRGGYLRWRAHLRGFHADEAERLLRGVGYDDATIERVRQIVLKQGLTRDPATTDPEVQTFEDGLSLVFLETQFAEITARLDDDEKMARIIARTLRKMSARGREAARDLAYDERSEAILEQAATLTST
ncbi:MAG: DUF4202 domain-containing protein [Chloroflexi bacterium]|nr:DUF4202 domain-containing protein [Chloroflexota bacterium]